MYKSSSRFYQRHKRLSRAGDMTARGPKRRRRPSEHEWKAYPVSAKNAGRKGRFRRKPSASLVYALDPPKWIQPNATDPPSTSVARAAGLPNASRKPLVICSICGSKVRTDRIARHRNKIHRAQINPKNQQTLGLIRESQPDQEERAQQGFENHMFQGGLCESK